VNRLDDPAAWSVDRSGMWQHIARFGDVFRDAWHRSLELELPITRQPDQLVIAATGGSAAAGDIVAALAAPTSQIPIIVARGLRLPNYVGQRTLVVAVSCSGDTAETLDLYDDAWRRDAPILAITSGGRLADRARQDNTPAWTFQHDAQPRAAIAHTLAPLLRTVERLGLHIVTTHEVEAAAARHTTLIHDHLAPEVPARHNPAKQIATELIGRVPLIVTAGHLAPVAERARNQFSENAKVLAASGILPEAAHNLVVGLDPTFAPTRWSIVMLAPPADPALPHLEAVESLAAERGIPVHRIDVPGATPLEQAIAALAFADALSLHLAIARSTDPTPVPEIEAIRRRVGHLPRGETST
jgi:glucose/mannose-6-phosphate isomerase